MRSSMFNRQKEKSISKAQKKKYSDIPSFLAKQERETHLSFTRKIKFLHKILLDKWHRHFTIPAKEKQSKQISHLPVSIAISEGIADLFVPFETNILQPTTINFNALKY